MFSINHDEARKLDRAVWAINSVVKALEDYLHPEVIKELMQAKKYIKEGMASINDQRQKEFDYKYKMFSKHQEANKLRSTWSIYEIESLDDDSGIMASKLVYDGGWGKKVEAELPREAITYARLWEIADRLIKESGDNQHVFIEEFLQKDDVVFLHCGS